MKQIVFAGMVLSVLLFTGCASKRNYIVRMDAPEMKSVVANEKKFFVAEGNELDIKVAPVFGKNGYLLLYVDAENKSEQPVHMDYTNFKMYGDYYSGEKNGPEHFVGSIRPADPNRTIETMYANVEEIREGIFRSKQKTEALKVVRLLTRGPDLFKNPTTGTSSLIAEEIIDFPWDMYQNSQFKSAEEVAEALDYTAIWLEDNALFSVEIPPGETVYEKVVIFSVPDYFTNIRLKYGAQEDYVWVFVEKRLKDLKD